MAGFNADPNGHQGNVTGQQSEGTQLPLATQLVEAVRHAEAPASQLMPFLHDLGHGVVDRVVHIPQGVADLVTHRHAGI